MSAPPELMRFALLTVAEQAAAIRRLAVSGMGEGAIASACRSSVEQVRRILAEANGGPESGHPAGLPAEGGPTHRGSGSTDRRSRGSVGGHN